MDLVEIRKKAKDKKKRPAKSSEPEVEVRTEKQGEVQTEDVPLETLEAEEPSAGVDSAEDSKAAESIVDQNSDSAVDVQAEAGKPDPLDALFSFQVDGGLATEQSYLQALTVEDETIDNDIQQWLTFSLANEEYALNIDSVSEIIKPREVTDIPRVPDFISGIISLRGIIVPVFDLNRRLKLGQSEMGPSTRIIVCQEGERLAGFLVDSINQVVNVPLSKIEPPPTVLSGLDRDFVEGVGRVDERMLILLHLSNVIDAELTE